MRFSYGCSILASADNFLKKVTPSWRPGVRSLEFFGKLKSDEKFFLTIFLRLRLEEEKKTQGCEIANIFRTSPRIDP